MTYEDIRPGVRNFRSREVSKTRIGGGRYHREYKGEDYLPTPIGEFTEAEWTKLALKLIHENGDDDLFQAILNHVCELPWMKRQKELSKKQYAAECLITGRWKAWIERGVFSYGEESA